MDCKLPKKNPPQTSLSPEQMGLFNGETLVLLGTQDVETQAPAITAISWVKAFSSEKIRFSVTSSAKTLANIKENPGVSLCLIGLETVYSISGVSKILSEKMEGVSMPLAKIEVDIAGIYDSMFWGAKIVQAPIFEKTYDPDKAKALDEEVYRALMK